MGGMRRKNRLESHYFYLTFLYYTTGAELSPSFEVYNDEEELLLKGKISGRKGPRNQREVVVLTAENENFVKLEFEEDEASQVRETH